LQTILTIHSGANDNKENSVEYLNSCIDSNAKYIEVDVRITKDAVLVLYHDYKIDNQLIEQTSFKDLINLNPNLLKIDYIFNFAKTNNFSINFDLKTINAAKLLAKKINENQFIDKCVISGCHDNEVKMLLSCNRNLKVIYNLEREDLLKIDSVINKISKLNIFGINLNFKLLNDSLYFKLIKTNIPLFVWTVDNEKDFIICKKYNLFSITTNYPYLFNKYYN